MINSKLLNPASIVVIGASNDVSKPGGKVLHNILSNGFKGKLFGVNPKESSVQTVPCFASVSDIPGVDLAIIAVPAAFVEDIMKVLAQEKGCKGFIILSAGFSESGSEGKLMEARCAQIAESVRGTMIGPNCIGIITGSYKGVFAGPIPEYDARGCDCVSASGATMVYILETAIPRGLKFRDIFSIGNSAHIGVEDVLQYWDETFDPEFSSRIKLLYLEQINDPDRFLKHARSLVNKGCRIAAIKSGSTDAGSRAVSSHTGALAGSNSAVSALFRKAGIIRCYSRVELVYVAAIFTIPRLNGNRLAVITHAGGPGVMLTDILVKGGMQVPTLEGQKADELLAKLFPGSSVSNPIDFLATGTAQQLGQILDAVDNDFDDVDGAVVVFGTTGMWSVDDVYVLLHEKMQQSKKPIFPILPSTLQAAQEVHHFHQLGHVNFTDEVTFGYVLSRVNRLNQPYEEEPAKEIDVAKVRSIISASEDGYLEPGAVFGLLSAAGISVAAQHTVRSQTEAVFQAIDLGLPVVMKVCGPVHKSDVGGVIVGVSTTEAVAHNFEKLMAIQGAEGVLVQRQLSGLEVYMGAKKEDRFGHQLLCGLGGIFVEVFKDVASGLVPVGKKEAHSMIHHLKSLPILQGVRGKEGVNEQLLIDAILNLSALLQAAPEIEEMDINPLLGSRTDLVAVDARIRIRRTPAEKAEEVADRMACQH